MITAKQANKASVLNKKAMACMKDKWNKRTKASSPSDCEILSRRMIHTMKNKQDWTQKGMPDVCRLEVAELMIKLYRSTALGEISMKGDMT